MKNFIILLSFVCVTANAQTANSKLPVDETTKLITYTGISEIAGVGKDSLFNKALAWCNAYYKNPSDVIREKNTEEGKIVCKARFMIKNQADKNGTVTDAGNVMYTMTLNFKDG